MIHFSSSPRPSFLELALLPEAAGVLLSPITCWRVCSTAARGRQALFDDDSDDGDNGDDVDGTRVVKIDEHADIIIQAYGGM